MDILSYSRTIKNAKDIQNFSNSGADTKVIVFVIPRMNATGIQDFEISFPFKGTIVSATATLKSPSTSGNTEVQIERCTKALYDASSTPIFTSILSSNLGITSGNKSASTTSFSATSVEKDDVFRINIGMIGTNATGLTVQLSVKVII